MEKPPEREPRTMAVLIGHGGEEGDHMQSIQELLNEAREEVQEMTALNMLRKGRFPLDEVAEISGLPLDLVKELKAELEA